MLLKLAFPSVLPSFLLYSLSFLPSASPLLLIKSSSAVQPSRAAFASEYLTHFIHIIIRTDERRAVMGQPHFLRLGLPSPGAPPPGMSYACILSPWLLSPSSPYMPSQINRSASFAYSAITGSGLVSVQYATFDSLPVTSEHHIRCKRSAFLLDRLPFCRRLQNFCGISCARARSTSNRPFLGIEIEYP